MKVRAGDQVKILETIASMLDPGKVYLNLKGTYGVVLDNEPPMFGFDVRVSTKKAGNRYYLYRQIAYFMQVE